MCSLEKQQYYSGVCKRDYDKGYYCNKYYYVTYKRWYYDYYSKQCKPFDYYGCGGNKNNFKTKDSCEKYCSYYYNGEIAHSK